MNIFTKFHKDWTTNVDFLLIAKFWACLLFFYSPSMNLVLLEIYALGNIKQDIDEYLVGCLYRKPSSLYYNGLYLFILPLLTKYPHRRYFLRVLMHTTAQLNRIFF